MVGLRALTLAGLVCSLASRLPAQGQAEPVRLRFIGAAFCDGQHRAGPRRLERTDGTHGRCNASARALWELHPIYRVERP